MRPERSWSELEGDLGVDWQELLLADGHLLLELVGLLLGQVGGHLFLKRGVDRIQASHGLQLLVLAVLDTDDTLGLKDTTAGIDVGVHLHGLGVDARRRGDVDEDGLLELDEGVDDVGTVLQNLVVHVALTTRETSPVGENHERQLLTIVEVVDGLCSLEGGIGVPDTTSLVGDLLDGIGVGGVGRSDILDGAGLDSDDTHRDAAKASTTNNYGASPAAKSLNEGVLVEQTRLEVALLSGATTDHPSDVVRLLLGRSVDNVTVPGVRARADGDGAAALLGDERHPLDNLGDTVEVVVTSHMRDTVAVHDLGTTQLQVGGVDLTAENVVQSRGTGEDDGLALDLDSTLTKTDKVGTNTDGTASHQGDGENVVIGLAGGTSNETRAPQALNTKAVLGTDNCDNLVALLTILGNDFSDDVLREALLGLIVEVEILEAVVLLVTIVPRNLEVRHELVGNTKTSTRVGGQVNARNTELAGKLSALVEVVVLLGAEATNHVGVGTRLTVDLLKGVLVVQNKLSVRNALARLRLLTSKNAVLLDRLGPAVLDGLAEELGKSALLLGATDAVEDPLALLRLALGIDVDINNVSRGVGDDDTKRVGDASLGVSADNADLNLGNTQAPSTGTKAVEEALEAALNLLGVQLEHGSEVDEDLVQVGVVVANDLKSIEDIVDDAISLGNQVLSGRDLVTETARANDRASEVALIAVDSLADTLVNVDVLVLREDGLDVELGQPAELKLEGKSGLTVTNTVVLYILGATESVVTGVGTIVASTDEGNAANVAVQELLLELFDDGNNTRQNLLVTLALSVTNSDVDNGRELIRVNLGRNGLALAAQVRDETRGAALSRLVRDGESLEGLAKQVLGIVEVLDGNDNTLAVGLGIPLVVESKVPSAEERRVGLVGMVLDLLEDVRTVGTTNVDLKGSQRNIGVLVGEEESQDVKNGVLGVNDLLDDVQAGLTMVPGSLTVAGLHNRRAEDVLHLGGALLQRRQRALDHDLTSLEGDLGSGTRGLKLSQLLQGRAEVLGNVSNAGLIGAVLLEDGKDERALGADTAVRQNSLNDLADVIFVLVTQLEDDAVLLGSVASEKALDVDVRGQQILDDIELVSLLTLGVRVQYVGQRCQSSLEHVGISSSDVLVQELEEGLGQGLRREVGVAGLRAVDNLGELAVQLLGMRLCRAAN
ncbi:LOW QUALITY PROTEIN: hypothetical protein Ct61P_06744 [Colletotrichum tofieldiae]|nr:LOW QUALITY PROTEIN: hypothetical protein Ct61P_06744 [Colletotrichum tofieldiae]